MPNKNIEEKYNLILIKIGLNITSYRKLKNITQEQLAKKIGASTATIANIEETKGLYSMELNTLFDIADALEISVDKLFCGEGEDD